jgi:iron(III) transport system permease protein
VDSATPNEGGARGKADGAALRPIRYLVLAGLLALVAAPLAALVWRGARPASVSEALTPQVAEATVNTLVTSGLGAALATLFGASLAWAVERTDVPLRNLFRAAFLAPFLMPPFIGTIGWLAVFGPVGYANVAYEGITGSEEPLVNLYHPAGIIVLLAVFSYPVVYVVVAAALRRVPGPLEEAARMGGASRLSVLRDVTLPLLVPTILAGFILTLVSNLSDFGVPALLGLPIQYQVLPTLIYSYLIGGAAEDPIGAASALGVVLLAVGVAAFALQRFISRRSSFAVSGPPAKPVALGRARLPVAAFLTLLALALSGAPLLALLAGSLQVAPGVPLTPENLSLSNIVDAATSPATVEGFQNSLFLAGGAALVSGVLGALVAVLAVKTPGRVNSSLDTLALVPQALPGAVVAVGWILVSIPLGFYNTSYVILFAYVTAFLALVVQAVRGPLANIPESFEEAARLSGASPARALADVTLPLVSAAILAGAALVFFTAIRELTISALLVSPGTQTLGVVIFNLQDAGAFGSSQALALLVAAASLLGAGGAMFILRTRSVYGEN